MANVKKANRVQDIDIKRLNHLGLGLKAIADLLGCHPATVTLRLQALGIDATDTRRSFMEQVFNGLNKQEQDWLSHNLFNNGIGIKDFVIMLVKEAYVASAHVAVAVAPAPMPAMVGGPVPDVQTAVSPEAVDEVLGDAPPEVVLGGSSGSPSPENTVEAEKIEETSTSTESLPIVPTPRVFGE
jgi:hypothetical protein